MASERPLAVMTGTSRDVGEFTSYGLAQAEFDLVGGYRNPAHREDQEAIVGRLRKEWKAKMSFVEGDITDPAVQDQYVDKVAAMGGSVRTLILSAAGGYARNLAARSAEEQAAAFADSRRINVDAQLGLLSRMRQFMSEGSSVIYLTSDPAHNAHKLVGEGQDEVTTMGDYASVAVPKNAAERTLRGMIPELSQDGINAYFLVGNALEGSFVTRVLKRSNPQAVNEWLSRTEDGYFPTVMDMAAATVRLARGNYPSGHTEYVGVAEPYQLYRGHQLKG